MVHQTHVLSVTDKLRCNGRHALASAVAVVVFGQCWLSFWWHGGIGRWWRRCRIRNNGFLPPPSSVVIHTTSSLSRRLSSSSGLASTRRKPCSSATTFGSYRTHTGNDVKWCFLSVVSAWEVAYLTYLATDRVQGVEHFYLAFLYLDMSQSNTCISPWKPTTVHCTRWVPRVDCFDLVSACMSKTGKLETKRHLHPNPGVKKLYNCCYC